MQIVNPVSKRRTTRRRAKALSSAARPIERMEPRQMFAIVLGYDVSAVTGGTSNFGSAALVNVTSDPGVTPAGLARGSGVTQSGTGATRAFGGTGFTAATEAAAITANEFFTFGLTVGQGRTATLTSVDDNYRHTATGPYTAALQYSLNGGATYTDVTGATALSFPNNASTGATLSPPIDLTQTPALQLIPAGTAVSFRLIPYGASSASGSFYVFDVAASTAPDLDVNGTIGFTDTTDQSVSLASTTTSVLENAGSVSITVNRGSTAGGDNSGTVTVPYTTTNGTAISGTNYTGTTTGSITIGPGASTGTITVPILANSTQVGPKTFTVTLGTPTLSGDPGITVNAVAPVTDTVTIGDTHETFNLLATSYTVTDTTGVAELSVVRTGFLGDTATVNYKTTAGTAADGTNFTGTQSGTVNFAVGQQVALITVPVSTVGATPLTFGVTLTGSTSGTGDFPVLGTSLTATETIVDVASLPTTLSGAASAVSDIETSGYYSTTFAPVLGDVTAGTGSFSFLAYEVLDFNKTTTPTIYPVGASTVTSLSNLSVSLFDTVSSTANGGSGNYAGHPGNINIYLVPDATTANTKLTFDTTKTDGFNTTQFNTTSGAGGAPVLLGTFGFTGMSFANGATSGYETYTPAALGATTSALLISRLNAGAAFRLAVTPSTVGVGAVAADFDYASATQMPPIVSISGTTSLTGELFTIGSTTVTATKGNPTATITINRVVQGGGTPTDMATILVNTTDGTALAGSDYTPLTNAVATFAAGATSTTINVSLLNNPAAFGDKSFTATISSPTVGAGFAGGVYSPSTAVVNVLDSRTVDVASNTGHLATVQVPGPAVSVTAFTSEGNSAAAGTFASFAVADFNDVADDPTDVFNLTGTVGTINSIQFGFVNAASSFGANGTFNIYLVSDSTTSIAAGSSPLKFNAALDPIEGLGNQLGTKYLLGKFTFNKASSASGFTYVQLTPTDPTALLLLASDLNTGSKFRIALTPGDNPATAEAAPLRGVTTFNGLYEAPSLTFNYTPFVAGALPPFLAPSSQATFNTVNNFVNVTGPTTIIADPGTSYGAAGIPVTVVANGVGSTLAISPTSGHLIHLNGLNLSAGAVASSTTTPVLIATGYNGLLIDSTSTLNIGAGDVDVAGGSLATLNGLVARGFNPSGASWTGTGITSSLAAADSNSLTAVGVIQNNQGGTAIFGSGAGQVLFDGTSPGASDVLIKYTYYGDANLDGKVDGSDYTRIDNGFITAGATGWYNGDFNYDGHVDASDYTLIDNGYNRQGAGRTFSPSVLVATPTALVASPASLVTGKVSLANYLRSSHSAPITPTWTDVSKNKRHASTAASAQDLVISAK